MINNARVESDARSSRGGEASHTEGAGDYGEDKEKRNSPLGDSDGDGSIYDEEYEGLGTTRHVVKRENI
jgi:hypothetical protein